MANKVLTLDELIATLVKLREESPLGGNTVPYICIPDFEYVEIHRVFLSDTEDPSSSDYPSGVVLFESDTLNKIMGDEIEIPS